jgi:hypothetical protein
LGCPRNTAYRERDALAKRDVHSLAGIVISGAGVAVGEADAQVCRALTVNRDANSSACPRSSASMSASSAATPDRPSGACGSVGLAVGVEVDVVALAVGATVAEGVGASASSSEQAEISMVSTKTHAACSENSRSARIRLVYLRTL